MTRYFRRQHHRNVRVESFNPVRRAKKQTMKDHHMSSRKFVKMRKSALRKMKALTEDQI